jgi:hypothetical protein
MKNDRKETTACQDGMEANLEKMEPNPGEKEAVTERQENPNEEVSIYSLRAWQNESLPRNDGHEDMQRDDRLP